MQTIVQDPFEVFNPFYRGDQVLETVVKNFGPAQGKQVQGQIICKALCLDPDAVLGRFPHQLSGGQCQGIMIAHAILPNPKVIVADESVSMVDVSFQALILDNMLHLKRDQGIAFVYSTHDLSTA